ncbi:MAG: division/cell wall cluster transcriptional repressor MraZ [Clostridiales bacterium]|nr:division/cell wall cluster transcriptional repressor MraZ [Clostridiales bacterium]
MFSGEYDHILDSKYRYIAPASFREELGDSFVITKGLDRCLFVYTKDMWQSKIAELGRLSSASDAARRFSRKFFSGALIVVPDKQGRVVLTESLRAHAGLNREIVTIGVLDRLEIWNKEDWAEYNSGESATEYEEVAEKLAELRPDIRL